MKKYIVLLAGIMMSLATLQAATATPVKNWYPNAELNPYSCTATYTLYSTWSRQDGENFSYYKDNGEGADPRYTLLNDEGGQKRLDEWTVEMPGIGEYTYVVVIGAPGGKSSPVSGLPQPQDHYIDQYDVFHITVTGPTIYHSEYNPDDPLMGDPITGEAEFTISSSMGKTDGQGTAYCTPTTGARYVELIIGDGGEIISGTPEEVIPGGSLTVTLEEGWNPVQLIYYDKLGGTLLWEDYFDTYVAKAACQQDLVYSKWDDFMFVDNGMYGGKGTFVRYQWYKDGKPVPGATEQWYRTILYETEPPLPGSAPEYAVKIWKNDNTVIATCSFTWDELRPSRDKEPYHYAPARKQIINGQLTIERDGHYYNAQGQRVQ